MEGDEEAAVNDIDQWFSPRGVLGGVWGKVWLLQSGEVGGVYWLLAGRGHSYCQTSRNAQVRQQR